MTIISPEVPVRTGIGARKDYEASRVSCRSYVGASSRLRAA